MPHALAFAALFAITLLAVRFAMARATDAWLRRKNLFVAHMRHGGLGDAFCQTGLFRALRAKNPEMRFIVFTRWPELFAHLPEVANVVDLGATPWVRRALLHLGLHALRLRRAHDFVYQVASVKSRATRPHLVALAGETLRMPADFSDVRGLMRFTKIERETFEAKWAHLGDDFALIVPVGKTSYTPNKEWGFENHARLVALMPEINWVQLGVEKNPALPGARDLRGKTTLREMAWLVWRAKFVVCGEGFHNHLAGAFGTRCFAIRTGFNHREVADYPTTIHISAPVAPPCAPCYLKKPCPVPGMPCAGTITPERVAAEIRTDEAKSKAAAR